MRWVWLILGLAAIEGLSVIAGLFFYGHRQGKMHEDLRKSGDL